MWGAPPISHLREKLIYYIAYFYSFFKKCPMIMMTQIFLFSSEEGSKK